MPCFIICLVHRNATKGMNFQLASTRKVSFIFCRLTNESSHLCFRFLINYSSQFTRKDESYTHLVIFKNSRVEKEDSFRTGFHDSLLPKVPFHRVLIIFNVNQFSIQVKIILKAEIEPIISLCAPSIFSLFAGAGDVDALKALVLKGHAEAFTALLFHAGADVKLLDISGETAVTLSELNQNQ
ncbi:hypothetical protein V6N12_021490 [Hibiscus sabdariffa]|uniref:Uncharacterized protein n=1 Tax=Hibiscus sabdariffa TaxID=183260 RepID=A0ABR2FRT2_9ROSI